MQPPAFASRSPSGSESERFATAVLAARTQRQMSRVALAEQSGVALQIVEELERSYPVPPHLLAAICRNLDLPEPSSEASPLVRLALLLRQRRGAARLSRSQLADRLGVTSQLLRSIETATLWPSQQICMGLLAVPALQLQESDVAEFLVAVADRNATSRTQRPASDSPKGVRESVGTAEGPPSGPAVPRGRSPARTSQSSQCHYVVASLLVRFYANGRVCIEMRPLRPQTRRSAFSEEVPRSGVQNARVPTEE